MDMHFLKVGGIKLSSKNNEKILNSAPEETFTNLKYLRYTVYHLSWKPDYLDKIMQILLKISISKNRGF